MAEEENRKDNRRMNISAYGDILSVEDIGEYLGISKADAQRIADDPQLKKLPVPIRKQLISKQDFLEYLQI